MASFDSSSTDEDSESISNNDRNPSWIYDVFLSFCDKDTGDSLASDLYTALKAAEIVVFRDDDKLRNQDQMITLIPSVLHAIEGSRISIIVFSKNYADSTWCLQELEKIMECSGTIDQMVVPVFYDVDPSHVFHNDTMIGEAFKDLAQRISKKDESSEGSNISGFDVDSRNESEDIRKVVDHVTNLLDRTTLFVADHPVGVESLVQNVIQLLNRQQSKDTLLLGICGMGGIGKTTIAKAVYNKIRHGEFEAKCFLPNVRESWKQDNGGVFLQQRLLSDIYKTTKIKIDTVESGKVILQERLNQKKIFLVLDNVNKLDQLNALCGSRKWLAEGSRIIITARDVALLHRLKVDYVYRMKKMDENESLVLFCWHAFKQPFPIQSFADISKDVVKFCGGLPLALQVIGSFLWTRTRKTEWENVLEKLQRIPNGEVLEKLRISFDGLSDNHMKEIFLDIAFFCIGMYQEDATKKLEDLGHYVDTEISVLVQQSLVTVDRMNKIGMHDSLQEMGRAIIMGKATDVTNERIYDVFLSFRGKDCRAKFISHLYTSLQNAGIYVFRDDDEIPRGDKISFSLLEAIGKSRISVVVLSSNYADSRWCLLELESIMETCRSRGLVVIPVFYEVDPSEVRHQTGEFGEGFKKLISKVSVGRKMNWKTALLEIGGTAGVVVINSRNESEDICKVVDHVTNLLDRTDLFVADHPVGVDSRVQHVIELLNSQPSKDTLLLGIWGMGGIGKTTIAKAAYNQIRHDFEAKSFLLNVREVWEQDNGEVSLQQRLLSDIYKTTKFKIDTVESGKMMLQKRLRQKKIFLVLDDVNKVEQLNALCGSHEWFGQGSRIIITTRDDDLLDKLEVHHRYRMKEMGDRESLELFCWHAFKQPNPVKGFADLCRDVVKYSGGLPLALQVIGSFLLTRKRKTEWKSVLEKLELIPNGKVLEKLRISFDGLSDDDVQEIFLDIAFFFIGMDQEDVTSILEECGHYAVTGISVLVQQSLITVDRKNKIGMHDLLRDMGREIVRKKSIEGGKEPSRLWHYEDVKYVFSKDAKTLDVNGLTLKMSRMNSTTCLETKSFEKMDRLRLLQLSGIQLDGNYKYLSEEIRWLCWHGFPLKYTPAEFRQERLVAVDLKYSNLERVWKKSQFLKELKFLNLSHSHNLRQTPNFSNLPNLVKLILKDCPSLSSISPTIGHLKKILLINLKDCTGLCELPRSIYKLESIKTLIVSGCTKIDKLEEDIEQMTSLTTLVADNTAITRVPFALVTSKSIGYISLCGYEGFSHIVFPSIIQSWISPTRGVLSPVEAFAGTSSLEFLDDQNDNFYGLPSIFNNLQNLQRLWLKCKSEAQLNQTLASILDNFHTKGCEELEEMQYTSQSSNFVTSASTRCCSQVQISSSQNSLTSLLIQMGMNCHVTNTLRENILQKMPPNGSGFLPGDNYPDWLSFNDSSSSVTFEVPQVDGHSLKTIMCVVYSSSPDNIASEGLKVLSVINRTKNTIQLYKRDGLSATSAEEEWQKVVSNTEPGDIMNVIVVFENNFVVKKTTVYLIYDEPIDEKTSHRLESDKNVTVSSSDGNGRKRTSSSTVDAAPKKVKTTAAMDLSGDEEMTDGDKSPKENTSTETVGAKKLKTKQSVNTEATGSHVEKEQEIKKKKKEKAETKEEFFDMDVNYSPKRVSPEQDDEELENEAQDDNTVEKENAAKGSQDDAKDGQSNQNPSAAEQHTTSIEAINKSPSTERVDFEDNDSYEDSSTKSGGSSIPPVFSMSKLSESAGVSVDAFEVLHETDPEAALALLISGKSSSERTQSASTTSESEILSTVNHDALLLKFQKDFIIGDIFKTLDEDPNNIYSIKSFLAKLQTPKTSSSMICLIAQLESQLDQYAKDLQRRINNSGRLKTQKNAHAILWEQVIKSRDKVAEMKLQSKAADPGARACKENIEKWQSEIQDLKAKIKELESKIVIEESMKNDFEDAAAKAIKTQIEEEAKRGIKYFASAQTMDDEIKSLTESNTILDTKMVHIRELYNKLKSNL